MRTCKLPSGRYSAQVMVEGRRYSVTRDTKQEAELAALEIKTKKVKGSPPSKTVKTLVETYIDEHKAVLSPSTIRGYNTILGTRFKSIMGRKVSTITDRQWQVAINAESNIVSAKTVNNAWQLINASLKYGGCPSPSVKLPTVVRKEHPFFEPDQIRRFIQAVHGEKIEIPALLALHGLRKSEILALTWDKINLEKGTITVSGSVVLGEEGFVYKDANKTSASRRVVPILIPELRTALESADKTKPIFVPSPNRLYSAIQRICEKNGLPLVGVHGCRHSFASLCYHCGISEKICQRLGGWDDDKTMRKIYTHLAERDIDESVGKLHEFFGDV